MKTPRELRAQAIKVKKDAAEARRIEEDKKAAKIKCQAALMVNELLAQCRSEIEKAAESGKTNADINTVWTEIGGPEIVIKEEASRMVACALREEGFRVEVNAKWDYGIGSDPGPAVYYVSLKVMF